MASRQKNSHIPAQASYANVSMSVVAVTPEMAEEWLRKNIANRKLREPDVLLYMHDMQTEAWKMNGEAIKIAEDGTVLDGQHRLEAVRRTGLTVSMMVVQGLPRDTQETMDLGRKRTVSDALTLRGESNSAALSAIARRVVLWDSADRGFRGKVSQAQVFDVLERHPELRRSAEVAIRVGHQFKFLPASAIGTAHHLMSRVAPDEVPWFFESLASGAGLEEGDPVLVLRNRAMSDRHSGQRITDVRGLAYMVRAWNVYRRREKITRIQHAMDAPIPDIQ